MVVSLYVSLQMACHLQVAERLLAETAKLTRTRKFCGFVRPLGGLSRGFPDGPAVAHLLTSSPARRFVMRIFMTALLTAALMLVPACNRANAPNSASANGSAGVAPDGTPLTDV